MVDIEGFKLAYVVLDWTNAISMINYNFHGQFTVKSCQSSNLIFAGVFVELQLSKKEETELSCVRPGVGGGTRSLQSFTTPPPTSRSAWAGARSCLLTAVVVSEPQSSSCQTSRVHISLSKTVQT